MSSIEEMVEQLERIGELPRTAARDAAAALEKVAQRQIASGTSPTGVPWVKTQEGEQPLKNAASSLVVIAVDNVIFMRLKGHVARHNNGTARGRIERQVLPRAGLPPTYAKAIKSVVVGAFKNG